MSSGLSDSSLVLITYFDHDMVALMKVQVLLSEVVYLFYKCCNLLYCTRVGFICSLLAGHNSFSDRTTLNKEDRTLNCFHLNKDLKYVNISQGPCPTSFSSNFYSSLTPWELITDKQLQSSSLWPQSSSVETDWMWTVLVFTHFHQSVVWWFELVTFYIHVHFIRDFL